MNQTSSRSHAIFSVILKQQRAEVVEEIPEGEEAPPPVVHTNSRGSNDKALKKLTSKFHFVDLAGSERVGLFFSLSLPLNMDDKTIMS